MRVFLILLSFVCFIIPTINGEKRIVINKRQLLLSVIEKEDTILTFPVCLGKNWGQKQIAGDKKTPEGTFRISMIQNSSSWQHDFKDGKGLRKSAYGLWFFRLNTPMSKHIGIHGTCFPGSIGSRSSDGCIRLSNENLRELYPHVFIGMEVLILPDTIR